VINRDPAWTEIEVASHMSGGRWGLGDRTVFSFSFLLLLLLLLPLLHVPFPFSFALFLLFLEEVW